MKMGTFWIRVSKILQSIEYKDNFELIVGRDPGEDGRVFIQVVCIRPDAITGESGVGKGGKIYLSPHMVDGEIVRKAFQALLGYEEHEAREFFRYKGAQVFGPHIHIDALVEASGTTEYRNE